MHTLYRHYDKHDNLLYIGVTKDLKARNRNHKSKSEWFDKVSRISWRCFGSRRSALKEEARDISRDTPCFNSNHNIATEAYLDLQRFKKHDLEIVMSLFKLSWQEIALVHYFFIFKDKENKTQITAKELRVCSGVSLNYIYSTAKELESKGIIRIHKSKDLLTNNQNPNTYELVKIKRALNGRK